MFSYLLQDTTLLHTLHLQKDLYFSPYCMKPVTGLIMCKQTGEVAQSKPFIEKLKIKRLFDRDRICMIEHGVEEEKRTRQRRRKS